MNDHAVPWYKSLSVKLGLVLFVVVAGAVGIVYVAVVPPLQSRLIDATFKDLTQASALPAGVVGNVAVNDRRYQRLADTFSEQLNARIVVFEELASSLQVVADSRSLGVADVVDDPVALASAASGKVEQAVVTRGGQEFAEVARPAVAPRGLELATPTTLLVSQPLAERLSAVAVVRRDILIFGGVALAVSWLVGTLAALKITRRIGRLEVAADRIAGGDFGVEIDDRGADEIAQLARTFDRMRVRLANLDHARREFIANASHELRTPCSHSAASSSSWRTRIWTRGHGRTSSRRLAARSSASRVSQPTCSICRASTPGSSGSKQSPWRSPQQPRSWSRASRRSPRRRATSWGSAAATRPSRSRMSSASCRSGAR